MPVLRRALRPAPAVLLAVLLAGCGGPAAGLFRSVPASVPAPASVPVPAAVPPPTGLACSLPAPTTAAGYATLFAGLDPGQWGGADVAISVPVGARSVWLFGDTISSRRFVHSSAITQDGGCLHVSRAGAQLLPDDRTVAAPTRRDPSLVYWIGAARATGPDTLLVTARAVAVYGTGPWDFRDRGFARTALVSLDPAGDLTFRRWVGRSAGPPPDPGPMLDCEAPAPPVPHHLCYGRRAHPELRLAGGRRLVTVSQNWDDAGRSHPPADYRPLFSAG